MSNYANVMALVTMFCWGVSNGFMKVPSIRLGPSQAIRLRQLVMLLILAVYVFIFHRGTYESSSWFLWSICLGLFGYLPFLFFCQALRVGSIGSVNSIGNAFPVVTVLINFLVLNILISKYTVFGIMMTCLGITLVSFSHTKKSLSYERAMESGRAIILSLLACLLWGIFYAIIPIFNQHLDPVPFTMCLQFGTFISAHLHSSFWHTRKNIPKKSLWFSIAAGIFAVTGSLFFYTALHYGNSGVITAIAGSSPIVGVLFGKIVYGEKSTKQELLGICITVLGVSILSLAR